MAFTRIRQSLHRSGLQSHLTQVLPRNYQATDSMDKMNEMMHNWWDDVAENRANTFDFNSLWTEATEPTFLKIFNYLLSTLFAFYFYVYIARKRYFRMKPNQELDRRRKDRNRIKKKTDFLDSLAANPGNPRLMTRVDGGERIVDVVNTGEKDGLLTSLILKTEREKPETITVTIHFSQMMSNLEAESLSESLERFFVAGEEDVAFRWLRRARTLQGKVELGVSTLQTLEDLHKNASDFGEGCTLQVESWGILTKEGNWQLNSFEVVEAPMIYHSEYAAGTVF